MRAAWVLPSFIEGSGGHRTILQNIQYMMQGSFLGMILKVNMILYLLQPGIQLKL